MSSVVGFFSEWDFNADLRFRQHFSLRCRDRQALNEQYNVWEMVV
jgi:hypothetical protein